MNESKQRARNHTRRWRRFVKRHPHARRRVFRWCLVQATRGAPRISLAACFEALRGKLGAGVRLDNSWRAVVAREIKRQMPEVGSRIETRRRRVA